MGISVSAFRLFYRSFTVGILGVLLGMFLLFLFFTHIPGFSAGIS